MTRKRHDADPAPPADDAQGAAGVDESMTEASGLPGSGGPEAVVPAGDARADDLSAAVVTAFEVELAEAMRRADQAERKASDHWDLYLRAEAELENQRRRGERLREDAQARVRRELLARFLDVNDNLERALAHLDAEPAQLLAGIEATYRDLARLLTREGVQVVDCQDAPFDPAVHEAVGVVPVPGLDGERVISVERPGYTLNGELLRPARVMVGRPA